MSTTGSDSGALAKSLLQQYVGSLAMRDWEDPDLDEAMSERSRLVKQVIAIGEPAVDSLTTLVSHSDWAVRYGAISMLGRIKSLRAIEPLIATMLNDELLYIRMSAAYALEEIAAPETIQATLSWYRDNGISSQDRVSHKIIEYGEFGGENELWRWVVGHLDVPQKHEDYDYLAGILDRLIDEIGSDETHSVAPLMEVVITLLERYEEQSFPGTSQIRRRVADTIHFDPGTNQLTLL